MDLLCLSVLYLAYILSDCNEIDICDWGLYGYAEYVVRRIFCSFTRLKKISPSYYGISGKVFVVNLKYDISNIFMLIYMTSVYCKVLSIEMVCIELNVNLQGETKEFRKGENK